MKIKAYPVHPLADSFPMLPPDQMEDLVADIKEFGQHHAIILNKNGVLLDGRNRLAACRAAGIEPVIRTWDGDSEREEAYILSVNVHRRHIPKSIQVMAVAKVYPEPMSSDEKGQLGKNATLVKSLYKGNDPLSAVSKTSLSHARLIIREFGIDSEPVKHVMAGGSLDTIYQKALTQKRDREERQAKAQREQEEYEKLRSDFGQQLAATLNTPITLNVFTELPSVPSFGEAFDKALPTPATSLETSIKIMKEQQIAVGNLSQIADSVAAFSRRPVIVGHDMQEAFVACLYDSLNKIIVDVQTIADKYKKTLVKRGPVAIVPKVKE